MSQLPDVRKLRLLREVSRRGTLAATASAMHLTPSAVSQQLAQLEQQLGVELLVRSGRGVTLTPLALRLVRRTERVLAELERAMEDVVTHRSEDPAGEIRVACFATGICALLAPALPVLRDSHPQLEVIVQDAEHDVSLPMLLAGDADLAIVFRYDLLPVLDNEGVELEPIMHDPMHLLLPADSPHDACVDLGALRDERWITAEPESTCRSLVQSMCAAAGFEPLLGPGCNDFRATAALVAAGAGIAMVPGMAGLDDHPGTRAASLVGLDLHREVYAAVRSGSRHQPHIRAVIDQVSAAAAIDELLPA